MFSLYTTDWSEISENQGHKGIVEPHSDSSSQPYVKETRQLQ